MPTLRLLKQISFIALLVCCARAPLANAALLSLQPDPAVAGTGDTVSLDLVVSGLGDFSPDSVGGFDVSIDYDAAALAFVSYDLSNLLGDLGFFEAIDVGAGDLGGSVNLAEVSLLSPGSLDALQPEEFILATLNFEVLDLAAGVATVFTMAPGAILANTLGGALQVNDTASATVVGSAAVPLPGTLVLLMAGLFSLSGLRSRRRALQSS